MLSPKQTKFHVLRYVNTCSSAAMSGDNSLQTPKKTYTSSVISCCRLCGSVKDVLHCKNLFKMATEELLALAEAVFGGIKATNAPNATNSLFREDPSLVFSIVTEARDQTLPGSLLARETLGTRLRTLTKE